MTRALKVLAWSILVAIALATMSPIDLRPRLPIDVDLERALAFCAAGLAFALAYPKQIWFAAAITMAGVLGLEFLQAIRPDRHGELHDAIVKIVGASTGLGLGWLGAQLLHRRSASRG